MTTTVIIDADPLVYRAAHAHQKAIYWDHIDTHSTIAREKPAIAELEEWLAETSEAVGADRSVLVLSDLKRSFRKEVYPEYKAHRAGVLRPLLFHRLREYLLEEHSAVVLPGLEGDDAAGLSLTRGEGKRIVATIDKDLLTVPGQHYNWNRAEDGVVTVEPDQALRNFFMQVLTGDSTDGYPGIKRVGPVKAAAILEKAEPGHEWDAIVAAYEKAKLGEGFAITMARCAWILRDDDYDFETHEIRLWEPGRVC